MARATVGSEAATETLRVRQVQTADLDQVIAIDARVTGVEKTDYWYEVFHRYGTRGGRQRFFFVAELDGAVEGFVVGEVRDWEFGEPPCGWVFGVAVRPEARLAGIGSRLLEALHSAFRAAGVTKARTLVARDNHLVLSFFRSQGMMAAPFIALESDID
ncbi:MAG: GNAT family N-acetyltransferase [Burkholderiales bacterium]|nr:GNAT family N-acetyltransferase [Burkholderiales bacterium]